MLYWSVVFLVIALIAGALGFGVIGGMAYSVAKILFFVFLVLFVLSLLSGGLRRQWPKGQLHEHRTRGEGRSARGLRPLPRLAAYSERRPWASPAARL